MLIDMSGRDMHLVNLADLQNHEGAFLRCFATSEQLIAWVKQNPGKTFRVVRRGTRGPKLPPAGSSVGLAGSADYGVDNGDVFCGRTIIYTTQRGLRQPSTPGWG